MQPSHSSVSVPQENSSEGLYEVIPSLNLKPKMNRGIKIQLAFIMLVGS